ncbi:FxsA family protein [Micromonospora sp. KC723]|uniref:FxsA family protein n=1 Tax=Micromonospora sp. KC723 TaxID=2530381 RepID=UPI0010519B0A|nr:FxsA family protein [Micromonospora sp. KC723]TDB72290.1 FxsA family protein [Micromonospora sp. KC723]
MRRYLKFVPPVLLLAVVLELAVFVGVGRAIGFGSAVLLVFGASLLGLVLLRREGMRAWRGFRESAQSGRPPGPQVTDGLVGLVGALLLATPGLVSGLVGVLLLLPPLRGLACGGVRRATERRVSSMVAGDLFGPRTVRARRGDPRPQSGPAGPVVVDDSRAVEGEVVEGEIVEPRQG